MISIDIWDIPSDNVEQFAIETGPVEIVSFPVKILLFIIMLACQMVGVRRFLSHSKDLWDDRELAAQQAEELQTEFLKHMTARLTRYDWMDRSFTL